MLWLKVQERCVAQCNWEERTQRVCGSDKAKAVVKRKEAA